MIIRVGHAAIQTRLGDVFVATDSIKIFNLCKKNDINALMTPTNIKVVPIVFTKPIKL